MYDFFMQCIAVAHHIVGTLLGMKIEDE